MTHLKRPSWAEVALTTDLEKLAEQYAAEAGLWHDDTRSLYMARSAGNLRLLAQLSRDSSAWVSVAQAFLEAARLQLVQLRTLRANVVINKPLEAQSAEWIETLQQAWTEHGDLPFEVADRLHVELMSGETIEVVR